MNDDTYLEYTRECELIAKRFNDVAVLFPSAAALKEAWKMRTWIGGSSTKKSIVPSNPVRVSRQPAPYDPDADGSLRRVLERNEEVSALRAAAAAAAAAEAAASPAGILSAAYKRAYSDDDTDTSDSNYLSNLDFDTSICDDGDGDSAAAAATGAAAPAATAAAAAQLQPPHPEDEPLTDADIDMLRVVAPRAYVTIKTLKLKASELVVERDDWKQELERAKKAITTEKTLAVGRLENAKRELVAYQAEHAAQVAAVTAEMEAAKQALADKDKELRSLFATTSAALQTLKEERDALSRERAELRDALQAMYAAEAAVQDGRAATERAVKRARTALDLQ